IRGGFYSQLQPGRRGDRLLASLASRPMCRPGQTGREPARPSFRRRPERAASRGETREATRRTARGWRRRSGHFARLRGLLEVVIARGLRYFGQLPLSFEVLEADFELATGVDHGRELLACGVEVLVAGIAYLLHSGERVAGNLEAVAASRQVLFDFVAGKHA